MTIVLTLLILGCLVVVIFCGVLSLSAAKHDEAFGRRLLKMRYAVCLDAYFNSPQPSEALIRQLDCAGADRELLGETIDELCSLFVHNRAARIAEIEARYGLKEYFTTRAARLHGDGRVRCLRILSRFAPDKESLTQLMLLDKNCSEADLALLAIRLSASPRSAARIIESYHRELTENQISRLTRYIFRRRIGLEWQRCLTSESHNMRRLGCRMVETAGIVEAEELLRESAAHPDSRIATRALLSLADMKLPLSDSSTAAAIGRLEYGDRKAVYRRIIRCGYSERAIEAIIAHEASHDGSLGEYLHAVAMSHKHSLR